ncbi:MAG: iron-containing alcohol dehydrogenase [Thermodesulfobacteriota bacterium]|nr:iron-containing alcohol dehydrogenase [Thermodesulfobacteriota bacterium]
MIKPFQFAKIPHTIFGGDNFKKLPDLIKGYGGSALILTGRSSFRSTWQWDFLISDLKGFSRAYYTASVGGEPSPEIVDSICSEYRTMGISIVISVGGGSVIDAGKAVSAMLGKDGSVEDYLEGVGKKEHNGKKVPFIAVPTTSGTGSEATKNAVISVIGENGYKKSLRHDNFIPDIALIDPELTLSCPPDITSACGMDAFTQLLESYVSTKSSPVTDALAYSGLKRVKNSLISSFENGMEDVKARTDMAYASYISGITLANAGLGVVHGFASSIGARVEIPHGVVCGTLLGISTRVSIEEMRKKDPAAIGLSKYADIGRLFNRETGKGRDYYCDTLIEFIEKLTENLNLPTLEKYGLDESKYKAIVEATEVKNNPVDLEKYELERILRERT